MLPGTPVIYSSHLVIIHKLLKRDDHPVQSTHYATLRGHPVWYQVWNPRNNRIEMGSLFEMTYINGQAPKLGDITLFNWEEEAEQLFASSWYIDQGLRLNKFFAFPHDIKDTNRETSIRRIRTAIQRYKQVAKAMTMRDELYTRVKEPDGTSSAE